MLPGMLSRSIQVHSKYVHRYTTKDILMYTSEHDLNNTSNCTWWYTRSCICSFVGSQDALKHTCKHALKYVSNSMTWYTPNLLGSMLPSLLSRGKTLPISPDYMLLYILLGIQLKGLKSYSHEALGGRSWVVASGGTYHGRNYNVNQYWSVNHICIVHTTMRSCNAS